MAYSRSRARTECEARLSYLIAIARTANGPTISSDVRQAAFQGVVVQLHSALEEYFSTVIEDWVKSLLGATANVGKLPLRTRSWVVHLPFFEAYKYFSYQGDERKFLDAAGVTSLAKGYFDEAGSIPNGFAASLLIGNRTYPSWDNIKAVFARLGIDDVSDYLNRKLRFHSDLFLKSLSDVRASVTHMNAPSLALNDVRDYSEKIERLVRWLDHRLWRNTCSSSSSAIWTNMR